ncbi:MAG: ornithine carbamoyltransferase [Kiritimatiellae bacterium]|nr:ornithine carbamoyltransferase [Kiritimatiellia bacterium]
MSKNHTTQHVCLAGRSLVGVGDLSRPELDHLLSLTKTLKAEKKAGKLGDRLRRKNIALIFEKLSTRTRSAFTVAAFDEGANVSYMNANDMHVGKKESIPDSARVLGRMFDGILFRGYAHRTVELLARHAGVPVWNGLSDEEHPTQTLADLFTVEENFGTLAGLNLAYVGDGRNNVACSLMLGCAKLGVHFVNCTPPELLPADRLVEQARALAAQTGARIAIEHDPLKAVRGAHVIYTDVWVSMGEEALFNERVTLLRPYQVNADLLQATGNAEAGKLIFLHCLPAFHDANTELSKRTGAMEVTDEVFEGPFSRVFDQAENRMHSAKALMVATLA